MNCLKDDFKIQSKMMDYSVVIERKLPNWFGIGPVN